MILDYFFLSLIFIVIISFIFSCLVLFSNSYQNKSRRFLGYYFLTYIVLLIKFCFSYFFSSDLIDLNLSFGSFFYTTVFDCTLISLLSVLFLSVCDEYNMGFSKWKNIFVLIIFSVIGGIVFGIHTLNDSLFSPIFLYNNLEIVFLLISFFIFLIYLKQSGFLALLDGSRITHRSFFNFFIISLHLTIPFYIAIFTFLISDYARYYFAFYSCVIFALVSFLIFDLILNYFHEFSISKVDSHSKPYQKTHIANLDLNTINMVLDQLMNEKKIFKDPLLSLKLLADMLNVTSHQLSEYLNKVKQKSFSQYLMDFRVEEAKKLLIKYEWRTTMSIGNECGFNSHSSFGRCFKLVAGVSPGAYRSKNLGKNND